MRAARGLYDTGKNRVTSRTEPILKTPARLCIVEVNGLRVASGERWDVCYSNLWANARGGK